MQVCTSLKAVEQVPAKYSSYNLEKITSDVENTAFT